MPNLPTEHPPVEPYPAVPDEPQSLDEPTAPESAQESATTTPEPADNLPTPLTPEPDPAPEPTPDPTPAPEFDLSTWDGKPETLPEDLRVIAERVRRESQEEIEAAKQHAAAKAELYDTLIAGHEDPRVKALQEERDKHLAELESSQANIKKLEEEKNLTEAQAQEMRQQFVAQKVEEYKRQHSWLFDGGEKEALAQELANEGWDSFQLPEVAQMPEPVRKEARSMFKKNPQAGDEIILLVKSRRHKAPTTAQELAGEVTTTTPATEPVDTANLSRKDRTLLAVQRAQEKVRNRTRRR